MSYEKERDLALELAKKASACILEYYANDIEVITKQDNSPVTQADLAANELILDGIKAAYPQDAILSEETADSPKRLSAERVWIVDPLDGTKEFIKRNGEFTVNIALIVQNRPVVGVVCLPAKGVTYYATESDDAKKERNETSNSIYVSSTTNQNEMTVVHSRSHLTDKDRQFIYNFKEATAKGSSLKGCTVAEGKADVYVRFGHINEWDVAAMQLIIERAGGKMTTLDGKEITYNNENTKILGFLVSNNSIHNQLVELATQ